MANSTTTLITSFAMIMLFTIAILGFAIGFANDNDSAVRIDQDSNISTMDVFTQSGLDNFKGDSAQTYSSIVNTTIESGSDVIKSPSVFTISWRNLFSTMSNIMLVVTATIFGGDETFAIFTTTFISVIGILAALYVIKTWRGNP